MTSFNLADVQKALLKNRDSLYAIAEANMGNSTIKELGEKAMELISDYPLYVSGTDNISYADAILCAWVIFGDIETAYNDIDMNNAIKAYAQYIKDFDKANGEPVCFNEFYDNDWQQLKGGE